jgi:hypothetical protein
LQGCLACLWSNACVPRRCDVTSLNATDTAARLLPLLRLSSLLSRHHDGYPICLLH